MWVVNRIINICRRRDLERELSQMLWKITYEDIAKVENRTESMVGIKTILIVNSSKGSQIFLFSYDGQIQVIDVLIKMFYIQDVSIQKPYIDANTFLEYIHPRLIT